MWLVVELVPWPLQFTPRKKSQSDRGYISRSPKDIFQGLHYSLTWFNGFCGGRGKRGALEEKGPGTWQRNIVMINVQWSFIHGREYEDKRLQTDGQTWVVYPQNCPFWTYISKQKSVHSLLFGARSFLLAHIRFTPSDGPNNFAKLNCLRNFTLQIGATSQMIEKGHLPWSDFMVHHGVNRPLTRICHCLETAQSQPLACTPTQWTGRVWQIPGWSSGL